MPKLTETQRLLLRPIAMSDYAFVRTLQSNPEVMKFISSGLPRTEEQSRVGIERCLKLEENNPSLGGWIAVVKETSEPIGFLIIRKPSTTEETEGYEIGYSFAVSQWGKGYATEATLGMVKYAYQEFGSVRLVALIEPTHEASRRTLLKAGFKSFGFTQYVDPAAGITKPSEILEIPKPLSD